MKNEIDSLQTKIPVTETRNRFKSWALWLSVAALVVFCVKHFVGIDCSETLNSLMDVLLPVLVGFGIVNNPTQQRKI